MHEEESKDTAQPMRSVSPSDIQTVVFALDTLGLALANEGHRWSEQERSLYQESHRILVRLDKGVPQIRV